MLFTRNKSVGALVSYAIITLAFVSLIFKRSGYKLNTRPNQEPNHYSLKRPGSEVLPEDNHHKEDIGSITLPIDRQSPEESQQTSDHDTANLNDTVILDEIVNLDDTATLDQTVILDDTVISDETVTLDVWLQSQGITSDRTPIVTIGDAKYLRALHSLQRRLQLWNRGQDLVVLCLDTECAQDSALDGYPYLMEDDQEVMHSIALIKFRTSLELVKAGYSFVFLDGDVFLTGMRDPFSDMLPLSLDTWDMQFQQDYPWPSTNLNIGWFFARASPATLEFLERSFVRWKETQAWDQGVMNDIAADMESEFDAEETQIVRLRIHRLSLNSFQNFMLLPWQETLFGDESQAMALVQESTILHFTCIEQGLKTYMGLNFGGFADVDGYYSNAPPLLRIANISGTSDVIHREVGFALQIAAMTGRTLVWPDSVAIYQQRQDPETTQTRYSFVPRYPGALTVNYDAAERAGFAVVESRYLQNRRQYTQKEHEETTIEIDWLQHIGIARFEQLIAGLGPDVVPVLDFGNFGVGWEPEEDIEEGQGPAIFTSRIEAARISFYDLYQRSGMDAYIEEVLEKVPKCASCETGGYCLNNC